MQSHAIQIRVGPLDQRLEGSFEGVAGERNPLDSVDGWRQIPLRSGAVDDGYQTLKFALGVSNFFFASVGGARVRTYDEYEVVGRLDVGTDLFPPFGSRRYVPEVNPNFALVLLEGITQLKRKVLFFSGGTNANVR